MVNWKEHNKGYIDEEKQTRKDIQKQWGQFNVASQPSLSSWDHDAVKIWLVPSELNFDPKNLPILKYVEVSSNGLRLSLWLAFVLRKHFCS